MQVKKFEARSMKEALDLVKTQLGPDAIILSAKDNSKGFGLSGYGSVEITAAVSEETLQKKKFVESRLREEDRKKVQSSSARVQKNFIESMVNRYSLENSPVQRRTSRPYIDIQDEVDEDQTQSFSGTLQDLGGATFQETKSLAASAEERIKSAAQRAWNALALESETKTKPVALRDSSGEIQSLKQELAQLKQTLS